MIFILVPHFTLMLSFVCKFSINYSPKYNCIFLCFIFTKTYRMTESDFDQATEVPDKNSWLYVPEASYVTMRDPTAIQKDGSLGFEKHDESHLGGYPFFLIPKGNSTEEPHKGTPGQLTCPKCNAKESLFLIAQLFVPLEGADRVTYIFGCNAYNCAYFCAKRYTLPEQSSDAQPENEGWITPSSSDASSETSTAQVYLNTDYPCLPFTSLIQERETEAYEQYLKRVRAESKAITAKSTPSDVPPPDLPPDAATEEAISDPVLKEYILRTEQYHNQVVRWCPKADPVLICSTQNVTGFASEYAHHTKTVRDFSGGKDASPVCRTNLSASVPPCGQCGHHRQFELQVFSTAVYLLGSGYGDWYMNDTMASLGTIMLFSCMNTQCGVNAYVDEYVAYQAGV